MEGNLQDINEWIKDQMRPLLAKLDEVTIEAFILGGGVVIDHQIPGPDGIYRDPTMPYRTTRIIKRKDQIYNTELIGGL